MRLVYPLRHYLSMSVILDGIYERVYTAHKGRFIHLAANTLMAKKKLKLLVTDIAFHTKEFRPASKFAKTIRGMLPSGQWYGRLFSPVVKTKPSEVEQVGTPQCVLTLPPDIQEQIDRDELEIELVLPEGGVPIYAGTDQWRSLRP